MGWPDRAGLDRAGGMLERWRQKREKTSDFKLQLLLQGLAENKAAEELEKSRAYEIETYEAREDARRKSSAQTFDLQQGAREDQAARIWGQQRSEARQGSQEGAANAAALARRPGYLELLASLTPEELKIRAGKNFDQRPVQMQDGQPVPGRSVEEMLAEVAALQTRKNLAEDQENRAVTSAGEVTKLRMAGLERDKMANETLWETYNREADSAGDPRSEQERRTDFLVGQSRARTIKTIEHAAAIEKSEKKALEDAKVNAVLAPLGVTKLGIGTPGSMDAFKASQLVDEADDLIKLSSEFTLTSPVFEPADSGRTTANMFTEKAVAPNKTLIDAALGDFKHLKHPEDLFSKGNLLNRAMAPARDVVMDNMFGQDLGNLRINVGNGLEYMNNNYQAMRNGNQMLSMMAMLAADSTKGQAIRRRVLAGMISARLYSSAK